MRRIFNNTATTIAKRNLSKLYQKEIDGEVVIKPIRDIVIHKDGGVFFNPNEKMLAEDGWVEYVYVAPGLTEEEVFAKVKKSVIQCIEAYDTSEEVNNFYIGDNSLWLDLAKRVGLELRFKAEVAQGRDTTTLWHDGMQFPLRLDSALQMLYALEIYASACYDNTQRHLAAVESLTTIEEVRAYDYTTGYPEKLRF